MGETPAAPNTTEADGTGQRIHLDGPSSSPVQPTQTAALAEWDLKTLKTSLRAIGLSTKGGTATLRSRLLEASRQPESASDAATLSQEWEEAAPAQYLVVEFALVRREFSRTSEECGALEPGEVITALPRGGPGFCSRIWIDRLTIAFPYDDTLDPGLRSGWDARRSSRPWSSAG
jgi:hypothetical protein